MGIIRTGRALTALILAAGTARAATEMTAWTVDGGGGRLSGGPWTLAGTFGQPDAGVLAGATFTLQGGFWFGGLPASPVARDDADPVPASARLDLPPAYPNPFNPGATIAFALTAPARTRVHILNLRGELVATLLDSERGAGRHRISWDGRDDRGANVASGVYVVVVESGGDRATRRVTLVR